jgi:alpha-tubulin suppressor-like RCC1 family protein
MVPVNWLAGSHSRPDRRRWWRLAPAAVAATLALSTLGMAAASAAAAAHRDAVAPRGGHTVTVAGLHGVTAVSAGIGFFLALLKTGQVEAWGANQVGQLGDGTTTNSATPVMVKGLSHVTAISAGGFASLALLSNGSVMAWGSDRFGQLGNGSSGTISTVPVAVASLTGVTALSAGFNHDLAVLGNGTVMAWGANTDDDLGFTTSGGFSDIPAAVPGLASVSAVSAGRDHSLALLKDGTVRAWGSNSNAQLGIGNINPAFSETPLPVKHLSGVTAISAGDVFSLALLGTGQVRGWGDDGSGELGNGVNPPFYTVPVAVHRLTTATAVAASDDQSGNGPFSVALVSGGTADDWGATSAGNEVPRPIPGATGVTAISPGLLLLSNGTVKEFTP